MNAYTPLSPLSKDVLACIPTTRRGVSLIEIRRELQKSGCLWYAGQPTSISEAMQSVCNLLGPDLIVDQPGDRRPMYRLTSRGLEIAQEILSDCPPAAEGQVV
jgi:hypothetical protein